MVRGVEDEGVVQLVSVLQRLDDLLNALVHGLQSLESLGLQHVSEALVDGQHLLRVPQNPLLVRVGREIVGWSVMT